MNKICDFLNQFPEIETTRIILKRHYYEDVDDMYSIFSSEKTTKFLHRHTDKEITKKIVKRKIETMFHGTKREWVLEDKETKKVIGVFELDFDIKNNSVEVSYVLGYKYWKQGYMTEVLSKMISICFLNLDINRIEADCVSKNIDSIKLLNRIGMKMEGSERQGSYNTFTNEFDEFVYFSFLKKDYIVK